jgi:hypothetical protein
VIDQVSHLCLLQVFDEFQVHCLGSTVKEKLPLPGLSFLCTCTKLRCFVQFMEPYERGVRQRGGAGGKVEGC